MKLEHLEATKCIFQLTEEEKGEWVAAAVAKESWVAGSGGNGTNEGSSGGGKKEEEEEEEGAWLEATFLFVFFHVFSLFIFVVSMYFVVLFFGQPQVVSTIHRRTCSKPMHPRERTV